MKTLHVLLEGDDDVQFFRKVFEARFSKYHIKIYAYAIRSRKANKLYIEALNRVGSDYSEHKKFLQNTSRGLEAFL